MSAAPTVTILPDGDRALLLETEGNAAVLRLYDRLSRDRHRAVVELVPAARTLLVVSAPGQLGAVRQWVDRVVGSDGARGSDGAASPVGAAGRVPADAGTSGDGAPGGTSRAGRQVVIPVRYDGEDLADVATELGITPEEVIARHTGTAWHVGFLGFAPGFAYLLPADADPGTSASADSGLTVRRLSTPRTRVRAGAVGLADGYSAVYPSAPPGGWRSLGTTKKPMWDGSAEQPAALVPGDTVRFEPVTADIDESPAALPGAGSAARTAGDTRPGGRSPGETVPVTASRISPAPSGSAPSAAPSSDGARRGGPAVRKLTVLQTGPQTLLQDAGRPGHAHLGVSPSGALDRHAAALANALVGNDPGTPVLEVLVGGLQLRAHAELLVAVTGATGPVRVDAQPVPLNRSATVPAGGLLDVGTAQAGLRYYLAVQGGLEAPELLDSASTDLLAGLGPAPVAVGDELSVGRTRLTLVRPHRLPRPRFLPAGDVVVRVRPGPRRDWFDAAAWDRLLAARWSVSGDSNRVGIRLEGESLTRVVDGELPSEGMVTGSLQVPPSGLPTIVLADHPVTGGYPVIGVVVDADLDVLAQVRPGQGLRFTDGALRVPAAAQPSLNRIERAVGSLFRR